MFNFTAEITNFYTYRSAIVPPKFLSLDLDSKQIASLKFFIESNGYKMDNHIAFKLSNGLCVGYSDRTLYLSDEITVKHW